MTLTKLEVLLKEYSGANPKTALEARESDTLSLSEIKANNGDVVCKAVLVELICNCAAFFSVGKGMNNDQVKDTAELIMSEFYFLKLADFNLFFKRIKSGHYGQTFDRIDGNVIMVHLRTYCEERATQVSSKVVSSKVKEKDEDNYMVCIGENFLKDGEHFEEVDNILLASTFSNAVAISIKETLVKGHFKNEPEKLTIRQKNLVSSLWDYVEKKNPDLMPPETKFERATSEYYEKKDAIMNSDLTPFEKENAVRRLAGVNEVTLCEFHEMNKVYR